MNPAMSPRLPAKTVDGQDAIVLPLAEKTQRELRIRCLVRPDKAQALLLERLGLTLPQRFSFGKSHKVSLAFSPTEAGQKT